MISYVSDKLILRIPTSPSYYKVTVDSSADIKHFIEYSQLIVETQNQHSFYSLDMITWLILMVTILRSVIDPAKNTGRPVNRLFLKHLMKWGSTTSVDELPPFTVYQIKIVFSGTNECLAPRMNDLRTIALA